jgi:hypothetical protein
MDDDTPKKYFVGLRSVLDNERLLWDISVRNQIAKIQSYLSSIAEVHYRVHNETGDVDQIYVFGMEDLKRPGALEWMYVREPESYTIKSMKSHEMKEEDWKWLLEEIVKTNGVPSGAGTEECYKRCSARGVAMITSSMSIPKM